jgi:Fic family protein
VFDTLGFRWSREALPQPPPERNVERALFRVGKLLPEFVYDAAALEDNPYTFPEVKTLLDGVTVGGHRLSDQQQVLNLAAGWKRLAELVRRGEFTLGKTVFCELNGLVAFEEALEWGRFRSGSVSIAGTTHKPPPPERLDELYPLGVATLGALSNALEQGIAFFLFGALNQFFYDGNKRTARLMMNGVLLSAGLDAITIPAARKLEFNQKMLRFYDGKDGSEMTAFLLDCGGFLKAA